MNLPTSACLLTLRSGCDAKIPHLGAQISLLRTWIEKLTLHLLCIATATHYQLTSTDELDHLQQMSTHADLMGRMDTVKYI